MLLTMYMFYIAGSQQTNYKKKEINSVLPKHCLI